MAAMGNEVDYDIVIIGGGLVGASLLLGLSKILNKNIKIALIESKSKLNLNQKFNQGLTSNNNIEIIDQRSLVLSLSSKLFFNKLNIWDNIASKATSIDQIKISEQGKFSKLFLNSGHLGLESLGYIINIDELDCIIWQELKKHLAEYNNIEILCDTEVNEISHNNINYSELTLTNKKLNNQRKIKSHIVLAADGCNSVIRKKIGIAYNKIDYNQIALIANIEHELENNNIAYERFIPKQNGLNNGSFAVLPHNNRYKNKHISGIVWAFNNTNINTDVKKLSDLELCEHIQKIISYKLGRIKKIGTKQYFPLTQITANELYKNRVVLLGSSANHIHPIGGQGFNLGLRDVQGICLLLDKYQQELLDQNYSQILINNIYQEYYRVRQPDHKALTKNINNLLNVFTSSNFITRLTRGFSLTLANHSYILKNIIAERSMGLNINYE